MVLRSFALSDSNCSRFWKPPRTLKFYSGASSNHVMMDVVIIPQSRLTARTRYSSLIFCNYVKILSERSGSQGHAGSAHNVLMYWEHLFSVEVKKDLRICIVLRQVFCQWVYSRVFLRMSWLVKVQDWRNRDQRPWQQSSLVRHLEIWRKIAIRIWGNSSFCFVTSSIP